MPGLDPVGSKWKSGEVAGWDLGDGGEVMEWILRNWVLVLLLWLTMNAAVVILLTSHKLEKKMKVRPAANKFHAQLPQHS